MATTLKTRLQSKTTPGDAGEGTTTLVFGPDYQDGRNQEWATATPNLNIKFTVKDDNVAARFEQGTAYTFTVEESDD